MVIDRLIKLRNNKRIFKQCMFDYGSFFVDGTYKVNKIYTHLISLNNNYSAKTFEKDVFRKKTVFINNSNGSFSEMLICNHGQSIKLFDYDNFIVLTFFKNHHSFLAQNSSFNSFFPAPAVLYEDNSCLKEELLIDNNDHKFDRILEFYLSFYSKVSFTKKSIMPAIIYREHDCYIDLPSKEMPFCIQHGDCWNANVFNTPSGLKFIDFDSIGERFFMYDIMLYVFNEAFILRNDTILFELINGKFDSTITSIIEAIDPSILGISTKQLFLLAIQQMISERFEKKNNKNMPMVIFNFLMEKGVY